MDKQNIQLYKYLTDHDKTMNRENFFLRETKGALDGRQRQ
jgi:hypothetical protein